MPIAYCCSDFHLPHTSTMVHGHYFDHVAGTLLQASGLTASANDPAMGIGSVPRQHQPFMHFIRNPFATLPQCHWRDTVVTQLMENEPCYARRGPSWYPHWIRQRSIASAGIIGAILTSQLSGHAGDVNGIDDTGQPRVCQSLTQSCWNDNGENQYSSCMIRALTPEEMPSWRENT